MPQGPPELQEKWKDCSVAIEYLENRGYKLTKDRWWIPPTEAHQPTEEESEAMDYLILEWDFGGLVQFRCCSIEWDPPEWN